MANNGIVNSLTFTGAVVGSATIQAQSVAGNLTFLLPNQVPTALQILTAQSVNGNVVSLGWSAPQSAPSFSTITGSLALSQISTAGASSGDVIQFVGGVWAVSASVPGSGTVTSVALAAPAEFTVTGSPITGAGTLTLTKATQTANTVWAGPASAGPTAPTFRALVAADIPSLPYDTSGAASAAQTAAQAFATAADVTVLSSAETFSTAGDATTLTSAETFTTSQGYITSAGTATTISGSITESQVTGLVAALAAKAPLASPTFTGTVTLPATVVGPGSELTISESVGGVNIAGSVGGKGVLVGTSLATDGVVLWDNTGSNYIGVSANAGGVQIQTSGGGTIALSGGALTQTGSASVDNSGGSTIALTVKGNGSADIFRAEHGNGSAAVQVISTGDLYARNHIISDNASVAGAVTISNPATTQAFVYDTPFTGTNNPSVTATAVGADPTPLGGVWITHQGGSGNWTGFTINVTTTPASTASFSYLVIGS